jgi:vesicle-associated membrane protein 7
MAGEIRKHRHDYEPLRENRGVCARVPAAVYDAQFRSGEKTAQIKQTLQNAQDVTAQNLTKALTRGEQLRTMSEKADRIKDSATAFHREAGDVRRMMFWQKIKWYVLGAVIALVIIVIIVMFACGGPTFSKCSGSSSEAAEGGGSGESAEGGESGDTTT